MKKTIFVAIVSTLIALFSCNTVNTKAFQHQPIDTVSTVGVFVTPQTMTVNPGGYLIKVLKDTLIVSTKDTTSNKIIQEKEWKRDSSYFYVVVDTLRDQTRKPVLDKNGKVQFQPWLIPIERKWVVTDFNFNLKKTAFNL
jgi:hypothetical protein